MFNEHNKNAKSAVGKFQSQNELNPSQMQRFILICILDMITVLPQIKTNYTQNKTDSIKCN